MILTDWIYLKMQIYAMLQMTNMRFDTWSLRLSSVMSLLVVMWFSYYPYWIWQIL